MKTFTFLKNLIQKKWILGLIFLAVIASIVFVSPQGLKILKGNVTSSEQIVCKEPNIVRKENYSYDSAGNTIVKVDCLPCSVIDSGSWHFEYDPNTRACERADRCKEETLKKREEITKSGTELDKRKDQKLQKNAELYDSLIKEEDEKLKNTNLAYDKQSEQIQETINDLTARIQSVQQAMGNRSWTDRFFGVISDPLEEELKQLSASKLRNENILNFDISEGRRNAEDSHNYEFGLLQNEKYEKAAGIRYEWTTARDALMQEWIKVSECV